MKNRVFDKEIQTIVEMIMLIPEFTHNTPAEEIHERIEGKDHDLIIIYDKRKPAGFIIAYALDEETYYNWIMGVLPEYRKRGVGKNLIVQFETRAKRKGYSYFQVKSMERFPAMLHLLNKMKYEKCGYDGEGKIIFRKGIY